VVKRLSEDLITPNRVHWEQRRERIDGKKLNGESETVRTFVASGIFGNLRNTLIASQPVHGQFGGAVYSKVQRDVVSPAFQEFCDFR